MRQRPKKRKKAHEIRSAGIALLILTAACSSHPVPAAPSPTSPAALALTPPSTPAAAPPTPAPPAFRGIVDPAMMCVVRDGHMEEVEIDARDSTYQGQPIARAFPLDSTFATNASWYRSGEVLWFPASHYMRYGRPRVLGPTDVVPVTTYRGVPVFAEPTANPQRPEVIYLPTRPDCEFQPYMWFGSK